MKKILFIILFGTLGLNASAQTTMRSTAELTSDTSAWPLLLQEIASATNKVEILPVVAGQNKEAIFQTQVTTHSYMGAIVYFSGGILINDGWIRLLGSGNPKLKRTLPAWNKGKSFKEFGEKPGFLLVADDAVGGFFAVNGGALGIDLGKLYYLSPSSLQWEPLSLSYSDFLSFCFKGNIENFYADLKWKTWKTDFAKITGDQMFNFYPSLWSTEGKEINKDIKSIVPAQEIYDLDMETRKELFH